MSKISTFKYQYASNLPADLLHLMLHDKTLSSALGDIAEIIYHERSGEFSVVLCKELNRHNLTTHDLVEILERMQKDLVDCARRAGSYPFKGQPTHSRLPDRTYISADHELTTIGDEVHSKKNGEKLFTLKNSVTIRFDDAIGNYEFNYQALINLLSRS